MKIYRYLLSLLLISLVLYQYVGCNSDTIINGINTPPLFGGYDKTEAGVMMTLSALCYTAEGNTNAMQVRDSIILQLADTNYATVNKWKLAWGPGMSPSGGNLVYAAVDSTSDTIQYAICVRGTILNLSNIEEDLDVIYLVPWTYGMSGDSIAYGSAQGFDTLMLTTDPVSSATLESFLNSLNAPKQKMFITGHSLGGAMATLMQSWFVKKGFTSKFKLKGYTFAAPTVGTPVFVSSFHSMLTGAGAENHRCVNSKDVVPYLWAGLYNITPDNIPTQVPPLVSAICTTAANYLRDSGIVYKHVETRQDLGTMDPVGCGTPGQYSTYECWVGFEHSSATYLRLLDADTINWGRNY